MRAIREKSRPIEEADQDFGIAVPLGSHRGPSIQFSLARDLLLFLGMSETLIVALERGAQQRSVAARSPVAAGPSSSVQSTLTDTAVECTKLAVALEGCDRLGSFSAMGCRAVVRKKFQCPGM